MMKKKAL